jgi:hypothetical protein
MARKNGNAMPDDGVSEEQITRPPRGEFVRWTGETLALHVVLMRTGGTRTLENATTESFKNTESALLENGAEFRSADVPPALLERPEFVDVETSGGPV